MTDFSDRIAALEAHRETEKACIQEIYDKLDRLKVQHESNWLRIVKLEEAADADHFPDVKKMVPAPAGGLVERVAIAVCRGEDWTSWREDLINWTPEARAAIRAVADWFDAIGYGATASILRREVERA